MSKCDYCQSVLEDGTLCTLCGPRPNITCAVCKEEYYSKNRGKCPVCGQEPVGSETTQAEP